MQLYQQSAPTIKIVARAERQRPIHRVRGCRSGCGRRGCAAAAKFRNNGQTCVCANRIYVHNAVYDAFAEKLAEAVKQLTVGDGFAPGVTLGPLIDDNAVLRSKSISPMPRLTAPRSSMADGPTAWEAGSSSPPFLPASPREWQ